VRTAHEATRPASGRKPASRRISRDTIAAIPFLLPILSAVVLFRLLPFVTAIVGSLRSAEHHWVGLENYRYLVTSPGFTQTVKVSLLFVVLSLLVQIPIALGLALLFSQEIRGGAAMRTLLFVPATVSIVSSAIIFRYVFASFGPANAILSALGIQKQPFFDSPHQSLWMLVIVMAWINVGYLMIFLMAGLRQVPEEYYRAAAIDGARYWRRTRTISLPLLRRQLLFVTVGATLSAFVLFAPVQLLTGGGPQGSTNLIMWDSYERAFVANDLPAAYAEITILTALTLIFVVIQFALLRGGTDE
jgi:multiple sugar transport system permease protein